MRAIFCIVSALLLARAAYADVAYQEAAAQPPQLFFFVGDAFVRTDCAGALVFDRSTCTQSRRAGAKAALYAAVKAEFGGDLAACDARAEADATRIARIDDKIMELLASGGGGGDASEAAALRRQIAQVEATVKAKAATAADLALQVARLEAALAQRVDAEVLAQLDITRRAAAANAAQLDAARTELGRLRLRLVAIAADPGHSGEFGDLTTRRRELELDYAGEHACADREMAEAVAFSRFFGMVADEHFVTELMAGSSAFAAVRPVAASALAHLRAIDGVADVVAFTGATRGFDWPQTPAYDDWRVSLSVDVPQDGVLRGITCLPSDDLTDYPISCQALRVRAPGMTADLVSTEYYRHELDAFALIPALKAYAGPVRGRWEVAADCLNRADDVRLRMTCKVELSQ